MTLSRINRKLGLTAIAFEPLSASSVSKVVTGDGIEGYGQVSSTPMTDIAGWITEPPPV